ncbi:hypothetical protein BGX38DRAFT_1224249 [Terfezia claveryi]|nr:hypothetical protein BGX38DRAFT_1224249 [Terfezia claveryi]
MIWKAFCTFLFGLHATQWPPPNPLHKQHPRGMSARGISGHQRTPSMPGVPRARERSRTSRRRMLSYTKLSLRSYWRGSGRVLTDLSLLLGR